MTQGLLSDALSNPLTNIGVGLLSSSGPSLVPHSIGQGLAQGFQLAQSAQQQSLRNQVLRDQLAQRSQKQAAAQKLQGLLGDQPNGQMLGLLAEMAPGATAQGLLSQMFPRSNSTLELLKAANINPDSKEGQDIIRRKLTGGPEQLDATLKLLQIQKATSEAANARSEKERTQARSKFSIVSGLDRLKEVARLNSELEGTLGETGMGFNELRAKAFGPASLVDPTLRQAGANLQRLEQLTKKEAISELFAPEVKAGQMTDTKLNTFLRTKPGIDVLPEVNAPIIADMLQAKLNSADAAGIEVPDRANVEKLIADLRKKGAGKYSPGARAPSESKVLNFNELPE